MGLGNISIFMVVLLIVHCGFADDIQDSNDKQGNLNTSTTISSKSTTTIKPQKSTSTNITKGRDEGNPCRTPSGDLGQCQDISSCPFILLDLNNIARYLCFRNYFFPGICCPRKSGTKTTTMKPSRPVSTITTTSTSGGGLGAVKKPNENNQVTVSDPRDGCGKNNVVTTRVVGGEAALAGQWPWMVAIYLQRRQNREYWCGGAIINPNYVLTASHCVHDSRQRKYRASLFSVRLGDTNLLSSDDDLVENPVERKITIVITHANFKLRTYYNDIALMKMDKSVTYTDYIKPICLPGEDIIKEDLMGQFGTVTGWGATTFGGTESGVLRYAEVPVWDNVDCDRVYKQDIEKIYLCAGFADGGKDACQGDSGSPLMIDVKGRWTIVGIVSFGTRCADPGFPGVYTRVTEYLKWIDDQIDNQNNQ